MDPQLVEALTKAGMDPTREDDMPVVPIRVDEEGRVLSQGDPHVVLCGERSATVHLRRISALFTGRRRPPDFSAGPTGEYAFFFFSIEWAVADYCACTGEVRRDKEFEQLYGDLRRRPDRDSDDPLFTHLQGALRLYLSIHDVSEAEYDAVLRRLARSARTFALGPTSTNYFEHALQPILDAAR